MGAQNEHNYLTDKRIGENFERQQADGHVVLEWTDTDKVFDPDTVYDDAPNPTRL